MHQNKSMYITNAEKEGPFLKIWGQTDKKSALEIEQALQQASERFEDGKFKLKTSSLDIGVLCCAKYVDEKYYRARIIDTSLLSDGMVEVNFLDYGNKDVVPINNLRSTECFNPSFITLPPLSSPFILAEVVCAGGEWDEQIVEQIAKEIRFIEISYTIVARIIKFYVIRVYIREIDLGTHLVRQNLMQGTSIQTQEAVLLAMMPRTSQPTSPPNQSLLQYKSFTLDPNSRHEVYVSYITDGPCHFSVQLKKFELSLVQLMKEINSIPLKPLEECPIPGTVCLARCLEDNHICRAVVTSEVDSQYKLFYVDFGNTELVPPENLYQIAFKYVIPKIMAIRLSLADIEKSTMTLEMQCAFKQFVDNRLLMMEVLPGTKKLSLPKCKMWDPDTNTDVIEVINRAAKCAYPDPFPLHKGFTQTVKVSFVYSCKRFYLQLKSKEQELNKLMVDLQEYCNSNQTLNLDKAKEGQPCCSLFSFDQQWYRSLIMETNGNLAKVRYIDYGNEEDVPIESLKVVEGEYLTVLRPQAIECCLNGYQRMNEDEERDAVLEELILEQEFTMRVIDTVMGKTLVDLMDANDTGVTALLLEAIMAKKKNQIASQPAPVQQNPGKFDDRPKRQNSQTDENERVHQPYYQHDDRRPPRKRNDSNSNESTGSWRQDNKGFRNRKDNDWNERSTNDNFRKGEGYRGKKDNFNDNRSRQPRNQDNNWGSKEDKDNWNQNKSSRTEHQAETNDKWEGNNAGGDSWGQNNTGETWKNDNREFRKKNDRDNKWGNDDNRGGFKNRNREDNGEWNNKASDDGGKGGGFKGKTFGENSWGDNKEKSEGKSFGENTWGDNKGKSERQFGDRNKDRGEFKKPYRKDAGEFSSSGSEKSFGKGFRTSSRNDNRPPRNFDNKRSDNAWNVSAVPSVIDSAPNDAVFKTLNVSGRQENITISWFHNPCSFFCQLVESQESFRSLMQNIQEAYKGRPAGTCVKGAPAIGLFPEDNVLYRARIMDVIGNQYKIHYVDFGNVSMVDKVWPIENKFMEMPMQAVPCSLKGVMPVGDNWPDPDNFSNYFERDCLSCNFDSSDSEGRYLVSLHTDDNDVGAQLVNDGLAAYCASPDATSFELPLFVGQQFRAMLSSANSPSDFTVLLQSGISLNCSIHNLSDATEIFENVLKEQMEQILIVYADNIVDDRLEVTLYDSLGNKLNIIVPDEGAFDVVEPFCPRLVFASTISGYVTHVNDASVVIQPKECVQGLELLLENMYEYYENAPPEGDPLVPEEGNIYAAKSVDGNWYRARVTSFDDDKATVLYLDYGNSEEVEFTRLKELAPDFLQWEGQGILVHVKVPTEPLVEQDVTAVIYYGELGWEGDVHLNDYPAVTLPPSESEEQPSTVAESQQYVESSAEAVVESYQVTSDDASTNGPTVDGSASSGVVDDVVPPSADASSERKEVVLSHVDGPNDFYIQLVEHLDMIDQLQSTMQTEVEKMTRLESVTVGGLCAAPYSIDQQWYRSQILDADDDITTVRFIDYGNTDVIDNKTTEVKTLTPELLSLEEYATRCRLKIKPIEEEWSKEATDRFQELTSVEDLKVEYVDQDEKTNYVELYSDGRNVKDLLIGEKFALLDDLVIDGKLTGFVSHINSPSEFWVQMENCCNELEWIAEQLSSANAFPDLDDLTPGSLCAAMFPDDEMWYRARILSNTVAGIEVLFLDYGNSCRCANLKQLPEHLVMAPTLAQKCSLRKPDGMSSSSNWSQEAAKKFVELAADGQTIFTVKKLTTGETSTVELLIDGANVVSKMLPTNVDNGYVTDVESLEGFSVKRGETDESVENCRLEKVADADYNQESLEKFVELCDEGKA